MNEPDDNHDPESDQSEYQTDKGRSKITIGCLSAIAVGAVALVLLFLAKWFFHTEIGHGVTAEEANRKLWTNFVPASATDVWFYSNRHQTRIDCKLDVADFQAWCQRNDWQPTAIVAGQPRPTWSERTAHIVSVDSGFYFDALHGKDRRGSVGCYDDKTQRACVSFLK